jgi:hypothetical protein
MTEKPSPEAQAQPDPQPHAQPAQPAPVLIDDGGHGHSVAAWTSVIVILVGSLVMAIAVLVAIVWLFFVGAAVVVVGAILGKVLSAMGFGVQGRDRAPSGVR